MGSRPPERVGDYRSDGAGQKRYHFATASEKCSPCAETPEVRTQELLSTLLSKRYTVTDLSPDRLASVAVPDGLIRQFILLNT